MFVEEKTHIGLFDHTVPPIAKPNKKTYTRLKMFITLQLNNTDHRHNMNVVTTVRLTPKKREKASRVKNSSSCNLVKFSSEFLHTYIHTYIQSFWFDISTSRNIHSVLDNDKTIIFTLFPSRLIYYSLIPRY